MIREALALARLAIETEAAFLRYAALGWATDPEDAPPARLTIHST